jgi:hypothetical protein
MSTVGLYARLTHPVVYALTYGAELLSQSGVKYTTVATKLPGFP